MTQKNNLTTIYVIATIALILSIISMINIALTSTATEWRCSYAECTEYIEISGEEWARENCAITTEGTMCLATLDDGRQFQIPLEELNLTALTATKCLEYVCTEEAPYRTSNYKIEI